MPKLPIVSGKIMIKILEHLKFVFTRSRGSHRVFIKKINNNKLIIVVPYHQELDIKTLKSILRQSKITEEEFIILYQKYK